MGRSASVRNYSVNLSDNLTIFLSELKAKILSDQVENRLTGAFGGRGGLVIFSKRSVHWGQKKVTRSVPILKLYCLLLA